MTSRFATTARAAQFCLSGAALALSTIGSPAAAKEIPYKPPAHATITSVEEEPQVYDVDGGSAKHVVFSETTQTWRLSAPNPLRISPSQIKVSENTLNTLPGFEVVAGIGFTPGYGAVATILEWQWFVEGGEGGQGWWSMLGYPDIEQWSRMYDYLDGGPRDYPYQDLYAKPKRKATMDIEAPGEGFDEGANSVVLRLGGVTMVSIDRWNPATAAWSTGPLESKDFAQEYSTRKDVYVSYPYMVWKAPDLNYVKKPHQASLTVELWDKNLTLLSDGGNVQDYESPTVRVVCPNGSLPPSDGTGSNQRVVCSDTRVHTGGHPPVEVHVMPDFDPIEVTIFHRTWDIKRNAGRVYRRHRALDPTQLWCVQPGSPDSVPTPPDTVHTPEPVPERTQTPLRTPRWPRPLIQDPESGGQVATNRAIDIEIVSLSLHALPETLRVCGDLPGFKCPDCIQSGDSVEFRFTVRDGFGRHFADTISMRVPAPGDLQSPDTLDLRQPILQLVGREDQYLPAEPVDVVAYDLAGLAFGEYHPIPQVMVRDLVNGSQMFTDPDGVAHDQVAFGSRFQLLITDPQQRYQPLNLPPSLQVTRPLTVQPTQEFPYLQDDRYYIWLTPSWTSGPLAFGAGTIIRWLDGYSVNIGAVSRLNPAHVVSAEARYLSDGAVIAQANMAPWGATDRGSYGYIPALFYLDRSSVGDAQIERMIQEGAVVLCVHSTDYLDPVCLQLPIAYRLAASVGEDDPFVNAPALLLPSPSPAVSRATIRYATPSAGDVRLAIYDVRGREIATLADGPQAAGAHEMTWNARDARGGAAPSGVYFVQLRFGGVTRTQKLLLAR